MPTQNQDLRYRLLGEDVSAGRTFSRVAQEAKSAHSAISTLGQSLNATGTFTPLIQGVDAISQAFTHIQENGKRASVVMQGVGLGIAGLGAAFLAVGAKEQQAAAGLKQSIEAAGGSFGEYQKAIADTVSQQEKFGHSANDTQDALSRLVQATNDPTQAINLMGLAANVAAARHISLTDAATTLAQGLAGNTRAFRQFGISLDGVGSKAEQVSRAFDELQRKLGGQAQAQADTFSGRLRAMATHFEDVIASMSKFTPVLFAVGSGLTVVGAATDLLNKKRAEQAAIDSRLISAEGGVAAAEGRSAVAAATAAEGAGGLGLFAASRGAAGFSRAGLLRGGGLALGGLVAGQLAGSVVGGRTGSAVGDALTGAGVGAGIGSIVPGVGTILGGALGFGAGSVLGLLHHGGSSAASQQQAQLKAVLAALNQQQDAALTSTFQGFLPGELDALDNPKAAKVATATEALAKAKTRLARAQDDLNKTQSRGTDPAKLAAAEAHLTAAEANLRKAQYLGGTARIASAQAALDQAQARITALHAGTDTTAAQRRVSDARQAVTDAQRNVAGARSAVTGLTAGQVFGRLGGNLRTERGLAADQATLVDRFHLAQPIIMQIDALEKQIPGTLHRVAQTMTQQLAVQLNRQQQQWDAAANAFANAGKRAFKTPAEALGKQTAEYFLGSFTRFVPFGTQGPQAPGTGILPPGWHVPMSLPTQFSGPQGLPPGWHPPMALPGSVVVQHAHVNAQSPQQMSQQLLDLARHKSLGVPTNAGQ